MRFMNSLSPKVSLLGIGAPKAGTSWIARCLDEHPEIAIPKKEINFFNKNYEKGLDYYHQFFKNFPKSYKAVGEFSPNYLCDPRAAKRIFEYNPDIRLIVILRNPIDRAFSHFLHEVRAGQAELKKGLIHEMKTHKEYLLHGFYAKHLEPYLRYFGVEKMKVLVYEEIIQEPLKHMKTIYQFLKVDKDFIPSSLTKKINETRIPRWQSLERLYDFFANVFSSSNISWLKECVLKTHLPAMVRIVNRAKTIDLKLVSEERKILKEIFKEDVNVLKQLLHRDFPWKDFQ